MARTTLQLLLLFSVSCSVRSTYNSWQDLDKLLVKRGEGANCVLEDAIYPHGASFFVGCNLCECMDGAPACTKKVCEVPGEVEAVTVPSCMCTRGGQSYTCGQRFMPYLNTTCMCLPDNQVGCQTMPNPIPGLCYFNNRYYLKNQRFRQGACNRCACIGGNVVVCSRVDCNNPPGKKPGCTYKGKTYKKGDRFLEECNRCDCVHNFIACSTLTCLSADVSPGQREVSWDEI